MTDILGLLMQAAYDEYTNFIAFLKCP